MKVRSLVAAASAAALCAFTLQAALAQPARQPRLVTKDELRACMNTEGELADKRKSFEARKTASQAEVAAIKAESATLAEDQKNVDESNDRRVREFKRRVDAYNLRVKTANAASETFGKDLEEFNKSLIAYNDKCGGISYSREDKEEILKEREAAAKK